MSELKPCPFCGAQPELWEEEPDRMWRPYFIGCTNVDCLCDVCVQRGSEEEAISDWNRRYERTCKNTQHDADFMCSVCGKCVDNGRILGFNFCPNCGARVVGGDAE